MPVWAGGLFSVLRHVHIGKAAGFLTRIRRSCNGGRARKCWRIMWIKGRLNSRRMVDGHRPSWFAISFVDASTSIIAGIMHTGPGRVAAAGCRVRLNRANPDYDRFNRDLRRIVTRITTTLRESTTRRRPPERARRGGGCAGRRGGRSSDPGPPLLRSQTPTESS